MKTVAIAGATGAVGQQMLACIQEKNLNVQIKLLASARSKGKVIEGYTVEELTKDSFQDVDYVLGACSNDITKEWMPFAQEAGCLVIDNSSAFRLDDTTPLIIPEINPEDIQNNHGIISNPNCSTIIALVALQALHQKYHIRRMIVTTMQAVSGAGVKGIRDLTEQIKNENALREAFPYQIAYNLIPQIGDFDELGITKEEWKMQNEGRKIWHHPDLLVNCTCVRVPILRSHSESITIECEKEVDVKEAQDLLRHAKGVQLKDDLDHLIYPMPLETTNQDDVFVGRIRKDITDSTNHTLSLFCCGDQIRKGAATNAVQILETILKEATE